MTRKNPKGYWTLKENVLADARKYTYQAEWAKASSGAFSSAKKNGWLTEACNHMVSPRKPMGYWTLANLIADAKKYSNQTEWKKNNASAYATAVAKGWLDSCCEHMKRIRKANGYWTKEKCIESASKYTTIIAWSLHDGAAYDAAKRKKWLSEATKHMVKTYSHGEYTIFCFLIQHDIIFEHQKRFDDLKHKKHLPYDFYLPDYRLVIEYQGRQHFEASSNSMFRKNLSSQLYRDALKREYAKNVGLAYLEIKEQKSEDIEDVLISELYKIAATSGKSRGLVKRELTMEERAALANLGTWSKESVLANAKLYQTLAEWSKCGNTACQIAYKNGWIKEATLHMTPTQRPKGYWTKERVLNDAKHYKKKMDWFKASQSAYSTAQAKGWLSVATAHMTKLEGKK